MPGLYSHTTRATGTILTATIYNGDHQNHIDNAVPLQHDDYSINTLQMQTMTDPGEVGTESLATSQAGEFERLRFALKEIKGTDQWYETPATSLNAISQPSFRNLALNGDMFINQLAQGPATTTGAYFVDNWATANAATARLTTQQSTNNPAPGYPFSLLSTVTTAGSPAAGDFHLHAQGLEGTFVRFLGWGAGGASSIVISFKVRSSVAGTYALAIRNAAANRSYVTPLVINNANTWEDKTFVIPGDTTGTWPTNNAASINIALTMAAGSTYQTGSSNVWQAGNFVGLTGMTQLVATNSATFQFTAFQCEPGVIKSPFERVPFDLQLIRCKRYYESSYPYGVALGTNTFAGMYRAVAIDGSTLIPDLPLFKVEKIFPPAGIAAYAPVSGTVGAVRSTTSGADVTLSGYGPAHVWGTHTINSAGGFIGTYYDFHFVGNSRI